MLWYGQTHMPLCHGLELSWEMLRKLLKHLRQVGGVGVSGSSAGGWYLYWRWLCMVRLRVNPNLPDHSVSPPNSLARNIHLACRCVCYPVSLEE